MAEAADIGANFSNYQGNAALAGGNAGVIALDTKPLEQLAQYTFYAKRDAWQQKQKETDAKVAELADLSNISLNDLRGKDREQATKEYATLLQKASDYARKIPKNAQERIQNELAWQTEKGKFKNNYSSGKARAVSYYAHLNTIMQNVTEASTQDEAIKQLNETFDNTDISTPVSAVPNFKIEKFDIPAPNTQKFNTVAILGNDNIDMEGNVYNPKLNNGVADAAILGIQKAYPKEGTIEYANLSDNEKKQARIQATVKSSGKGWVDATEPLNAALAKYTKNGVFDAVAFENDNATNTALMNAYTALKNYNTYNRQHYDQAVSGMFNDKGVNIPLPDNIVADDFKVGFVDFSKGVNANQLVQSGMFAQYKGDVFSKKVTHSGDQRALDLERMREQNALTIQSRNERGANYRAELDLIGKGFTLGADKKWQPPKKDATTTGVNGGVVPYWQNYIAPQIANKKFRFTDNKQAIPKNFTGDIDVDSDSISGLSVALSGETNAEGKSKSLSGGEDPSEIKIRMQNGVPIGIVIDGIFYDQNDINSKATRLQDKNVNNKFDAPVFGNTGQQGTAAPAADVTPKGLPIFRK